MDKKYINDKVYAETAELNGIKKSEVERIADFMGKEMVKLMERDDPSFSIKLDYIGNMLSKPKQREAVKQKIENIHGRLTINKRGRDNDQSASLDHRGIENYMEA